MRLMLEEQRLALFQVHRPAAASFRYRECLATSKFVEGLSLAPLQRIDVAHREVLRAHELLITMGE